MWKWDDFHAEGDQSWWDQETKQQLSVKESPDLNNQSGGSTSWTPPTPTFMGLCNVNSWPRVRLSTHTSTVLDRWKWPKLGSSPVCRLQFTENGWIFLATPLALFMLCIIRAIFQLFFVCTLNVTHSFLLDSSRQSLNRWRYTGLVGNLSFDPEMLIVWVSTSRSSPCFTSQRDWEIRGKIYKERKQAPL